MKIFYLLRPEIVCLLVLIIIALVYFSSKRAKTKLHKTFSFTLITVIIHIFLEALTLITVNLPEKIPSVVNDIAHRFYIATLILSLYLFCKHIIYITKTKKKINSKISDFLTIIMIITIFFSMFLPIYYEEKPHSNYSVGPLVDMAFSTAALFLIFCGIIVCINLKTINPKRILSITSALFIQASFGIIQFLCEPLMISGVGITLMTISFYITTENPDVLLLEEIEQEKKTIQKESQSKSTFLSIVSHEIRTPMNAIAGMTNLLLQDELTDKQKKYLSNIKTSCSSLIEIINDLLDQSKIEAGKMTIVESSYELETLLNDIKILIESRIENKPIRLIFEIDESIPKYLIGDSLRIRQVLINLLNNAVKYTQQGYIELSINCVKSYEDKLLLKFSVKDTGQGIESKNLHKLFEAFNQLEEEKNHNIEGTGLGLTISKNFIDMMGGKLDVKSEYGIGSEFFFSIYQGISLEEANEEKKYGWESIKFTTKNARILVVDDTELNLILMKELLEPLNMQIDLADSGTKALQFINQNKYDLVFMDYFMPYMNGTETVKQIRKISKNEVGIISKEIKKDLDYFKKLPIVALSGATSYETLELFSKSGFNDYIEKPIDLERVKKIILKWLPEEKINK